MRALLPVVNHAPRSPKARAELTAAFGQLATAALSQRGDRLPTPPGAGRALPSPVFLPHRRGVEEALRDGAPVPATLGTTLAGAVEAARSRLPGLPAPPGAQPSAPSPAGTPPAAEVPAR